MLKQDIYRVREIVIKDWYVKAESHEEAQLLKEEGKGGKKYGFKIKDSQVFSTDIPLPQEFYPYTIPLINKRRK